MAAPTIKITTQDTTDTPQQAIDPELDRWLTLMGIPPGSHIHIPTKGLLTWDPEDQDELHHFIKFATKPEMEEPPTQEPEVRTAEIPIITQTHTETINSQETNLVTREYIKTALTTKVQQRVMKHRIARESRNKERQSDQTRNRNKNNAQN